MQEKERKWQKVHDILRGLTEDFERGSEMLVTSAICRVGRTKKVSGREKKMLGQKFQSRSIP